MAEKDKKQKQIDSQIGQALFSDTERFEMWFSTYWKPAMGVALIIAVAAAVVFGVITSRNAADKKAAFMLADASTVEELTAALKKYPDHAGSAVARFRLAKMLNDSGKHAEASAQFDQVVKEAADTPDLAARAALAAGYAAELSGSTKEAVKRFSAVESDLRYPASQRAEAGYCAGRLLVKNGDLQQAKSILGRTAMMGSANAGTGYWTENAKQTMIAIDNGEYSKKSPGPKAVQVKKAVKAK